MKTFLGLSLLGSVLLTCSGCIVYKSDGPVDRTVYVEEAPTVRSNTVVRTRPVVQQEYVTVLPRGYRTRTVRGQVYYYSGNTYYQPSRRGYVVIKQRPW